MLVGEDLVEVVEEVAEVALKQVNMEEDLVVHLDFLDLMIGLVPCAEISIGRSETSATYATLQSLVLVKGE